MIEKYYLESDINEIVQNLSKYKKNFSGKSFLISGANGFLGKYFIKKYSGFWTQKDNWKRFNRLIYEGKNLSARRTLNRISGDYRKLGEARLGLSRRVGNVSILIKSKILILISKR